MANASSVDYFDSGPSLHNLRIAVRSNRVAFPAPVPVFSRQHRADIQWRLVQLYFILGWSANRIAERYKITPRRVRQTLHGWVRRATLLGYLQELPLDEKTVPEALRGLPAVSIRPGSDNRMPQA